MQHLRSVPELKEWLDTATEKIIAHGVRTLVGTPDVMRRGTWNPWTNAIMMFSTVAKEGLRQIPEAWERAGTKGGIPHGEFYWKIFKYSLLPKLLMWGASLGFLGKHVKELMDDVPEYEKTNYYVIPLGWRDSVSNAPVRLTIPQPYQLQVFGAILWKLLHGDISGKGAVGTIGLEAQPYNLNPVLDATADLVNYYGRGINPLDTWRGTHVLPEKVAEIGGFPAAKAMAANTWNKLGGSTLYRAQPDDIQRNKSLLERALQMPIGNVAGRFIRTRGGGEGEQYRKEAEKVTKARARETYDIDNAIIDDLKKKQPEGPNSVFNTLAKEGKLTHHLIDFKKGGLRTEAEKTIIKNRYRDIAANKNNLAVWTAYQQAGSTEAKNAVLQKYLEKQRNRGNNVLQK
jgi:hypothetical protein